MELLSNLHFLRPLGLLLLIPAVLLAVALWVQRGREASWTRVVSAKLLPHLISGESVGRSRSGVPLLLLAWCIAALAVAGPSWKQIPLPVLQKQDALVLVMDLSYSMLANDLQPSRHDRVRRKLLDLLRERREGLTALIAYAGDAHIVAPLTDDNPTIANLLPALNPGIMPLPGSNPMEAITRALSLLDSAGARRGRILLVTDGVSSEDALRIATLMEGQPRKLGVLGVGTAVGAPIPLPSGGFLKDEAGEIVVPALDEEPLRELASRAGGRYRALAVDDSDLAALLDESLLPDDAETISLDRRADRWQDMAHWLVLPLLLVALGSFRRGRIYLLPLCLSLLPADNSEAVEWTDLWLRADQQGQRALQEGDPARAATLFEDPLWRGTAAFNAENYEDAEQAFSRVDSADAWYNRGNALAADGELDAAINAYRRSLELEPEQADAQKNIETLEQFKDQQQQQDQGGDPDQQPSDPSQDQGKRGDQDSQSEQDSDSSQQESENSQQQSPDSEQDSNSDGQQDPRDQAQGDREEEREGGSQGAEDQAEQGKSRPMPQPEIDTSAMQEDMEKDQAMQQWLRRVPDDPSGLLREKFRFESRQRQQQGKTRESKQIW